MAPPCNLPSVVDPDISSLLVSMSSTREALPENSPSLSLCGIYRRDVFSLLTRAEVEQWRLVSRLSNSAIEETPETRLPRRRLDEFCIEATSWESGVYNPWQIQPDGIVSAAATRKYHGGNSLRIPTSCLRWDFDPGRLEEAAGQLAGQPILVAGVMEGRADAVVSFCTRYTSPTPGGLVRPIAQGRLEMRNQLTRESATHLLHFFLHLDTGTYISWLDIKLWTNEQEPRIYERDAIGAHLNTAIFDALRHARGGRRGLELYALRESVYRAGQSVFQDGQEAGSVRLHFRQPNNIYTL